MCPSSGCMECPKSLNCTGEGLSQPKGGWMAPGTWKDSGRFGVSGCIMVRCAKIVGATKTKKSEIPIHESFKFLGASDFFFFAGDIRFFWGGNSLTSNLHANRLVTGAPLQKAGFWTSPNTSQDVRCATFWKSFFFPWGKMGGLFHHPTFLRNASLHRSVFFFWWGNDFLFLWGGVSNDMIQWGDWCSQEFQPLESLQSDFWPKKSKFRLCSWAVFFFSILSASPQIYETCHVGPMGFNDQRRVLFSWLEDLVIQVSPIQRMMNSDLHDSWMIPRFTFSTHPEVELHCMILILYESILYLSQLYLYPICFSRQ